MNPERAAPTYALRTRLLLVATSILAAFIGLTGATLDSAFRDSAKAAVDERLRAAVYMLLGAANTDRGSHLALPQALPDPRLATPESGFYSQVVRGKGRPVWRSPSMVGLAIPFPPPGEIGTARYAELVAADGRRYFGLSYAIAWEFDDRRVRSYVFQAAESRASFDLQVAEYRRALWGWLAALAAGLLATQAVVLHWALAPLRRVAAELRAVEDGRAAELTGRYPAELLPLTANLNGLIRSSRAHLTRYRNALADLAHSLKTPLAVMRTALDSESGPHALRELVREQVARIGETVDYQLQRAAASGRVALASPLAVRQLLERVLASLAKVYAAKRIAFELEVAQGLQYGADEGDLLEILGNLLDNACKWCRTRVRVTAAAGEQGALVLEVEDDGPGIPPASIEAVLARGVRADESTAGHGIGLAVVRELVEGAYRGRLELANAPAGGARARVVLPGR